MTCSLGAQMVWHVLIPTFVLTVPSSCVSAYSLISVAQCLHVFGYQLMYETKVVSAAMEAVFSGSASLNHFRLRTLLHILSPLCILGWIHNMSDTLCCICFRCNQDLLLENEAVMMMMMMIETI